jgi:hypothetical protein
MKQIKVVIPSSPNEGRYLLHITGVIRAHNGMSLESVRPLIDSFRNGLGMECFIPLNKLNRFIDCLRGMHVFYRVPEAPEYEYHDDNGVDPYVNQFDNDSADFRRFMAVYIPGENNTTEAALATSTGQQWGDKFIPTVGLSYTLGVGSVAYGLTSIQIVWSKKELVWWDGFESNYQTIDK